MQMTCYKQLQTDNLPTNYVENNDSKIWEKIYNSLTNHGLFSDEQKGCRKWSRGSAELLYINQHILNESKTSRKILAMAWIDYKRDMTWFHKAG